MRRTDHPLKRCVFINSETLPDDYDPAAEIEYVDIGNVDQTRGIISVEKINFGVAPSRARRLVRSGDTIISTVRTYLKAVAPIENPPENMVVSTGFAVLRPGAGVHPKFLAWLAQSEGFVQCVEAHSVGVSYPAISPSVLGSLSVHLPPLGDQRTAADFLDRKTARIDELIAKKEKLLQLTEERKRAEVTQRVMRGLAIGVPLTKTASDYTGCIPAHWTTPPTYARYSVALGKMLDARQITGAFLLPYLRNVDVQWDRINTEDLPQMDISPEEYGRYLLKNGDLLVCEGGEVGRCSIWRGNLSPCAYQKALHRMRPLHADEHVRYMFYTLAHVAASGYFAASGSPNTIPHLTAEKLRVFRFPKPPLDEQVQISDHLDAYIAGVQQTERAIERAVDLLREHRTALISAAVTGQINVRTYRKEPESILEAT